MQSTEGEQHRSPKPSLEFAKQQIQAASTHVREMFGSENIIAKNMQMLFKFLNKKRS